MSANEPVTAEQLRDAVREILSPDLAFAIDAISLVSECDEREVDHVVYAINPSAPRVARVIGRGSTPAQALRSAENHTLVVNSLRRMGEVKS